MGGPRRVDLRPVGARLRGRLLALPGLTIRRLEAADLDWAGAFLTETLGGRMQARRGQLVDVLDGEGRIAEVDGQPIGLITWTIEVLQADSSPAGDGQTSPTSVGEVRAVSVAHHARRHGVGRALLDAVDSALREARVERAWLVTTNDNLTALALYQKAGWRLDELRSGAIDELRRTVKPSIPTIGEGGIPLRDELELTKHL